MHDCRLCSAARTTEMTCVSKPAASWTERALLGHRQHTLYENSSNEAQIHKRRQGRVLVLLSCDQVTIFLLLPVALVMLSLLIVTVVHSSLCRGGSKAIRAMPVGALHCRQQG